ncbi:MAG: diacylglycerol kinase family protein [Bacteroidia bacterium]
MDKKTTWFLLINPAAGAGKAIKKKEEIENALEKSGLSYFTCVTSRAAEGEEITTRAIEEGYRKFLIAGGDGTLNEVVNGIMNQQFVNPKEVVLSQLPVGTGNDWRRTWKLPKKIDECIHLLVAEKTELHDIGKINFLSKQDSKPLWFINVAGSGFDAQVAFAANLQKEKGNTGLHVYLLELIKSLIHFKEPAFHVEADSENFSFTGFTVLAGVCRYAGNNMKLVPEADPQDGLLSIVMVEKLSKLKIIRNLSSLFSGKYIMLPEVKHSNCKKISIRSEPDFHVQVDGESKGKSPIEIEIFAQAISVIVP